MRTDPVKLPVLATVREAYNVWCQNLRLWVQLVGIPASMLFVVGGVVQLTGASGNLSVAVVLTAVLVLYFLSLIPFATAWHRLVLCPEDIGSHKYLMQGREALYSVTLIMISVIFVVSFLATGSIVIHLFLPPMMEAVFDAFALSRAENDVQVLFIAREFVSLGLYAVIAFLVGPIILMLPAAAIDASVGVREVYVKIRGNRGRLIALFVLAYTPVKLLEILILWLFGELIFLLYIPALLFMPVIVGVVSITYRELVQKPEAAA